MRLSQLAVNQSAQGQGLGKVMLARALDTSVELSETVGIYAVVVDAIDESARNFYLKYGFTPFIDQPMSLFISVNSIS